MNVTLTGGELYVGATVGVARRLAAMKRVRLEVYGAAANYWQTDIEGALAELAVAKVLNRYWASPLLESVGRSTDLEGVNVRSTPHVNGRLLLHKSDQDEIPYVLVRGCSPTYDVAGWAYGRDGKLEANWRTDIRSPCYMVDASKLRPINDLIFILRGRASDNAEAGRPDMPGMQDADTGRRIGQPQIPQGLPPQGQSGKSDRA